MAPCQDCNNKLVITAIKWIPWVSLVFIGWLSWISLASIADAKINVRQAVEINTNTKNMVMIVDALKAQSESFYQMSQDLAIHTEVHKVNDRRRAGPDNQAGSSVIDQNNVRREIDGT